QRKSVRMIPVEQSIDDPVNYGRRIGAQTPADEVAADRLDLACRAIEGGKRGRAYRRAHCCHRDRMCLFALLSEPLACHLGKAADILRRYRPRRTAVVTDRPLQCRIDGREDGARPRYDLMRGESDYRARGLASVRHDCTEMLGRVGEQ